MTQGLPSTIEGSRPRRPVGLAGRLRRALMGLGPRQLAPILRLFDGAEPRVRARLCAIVDSFVEGYHLGLEAPDLDTLLAALETHEPERRGFAYEGAGMGIGLRVLVTPGSQLLSAFLDAADPHHYMIQVGAGWALTTVPIRHDAMLDQCDSRYHWLAWDGYGFCEALFHPEQTIARGRRRPRRTDFALQAFDHGVGRALWFVRTADPARVAAAIEAFAPERRSGLWGGVGLAAAYAGGIDDAMLETLTRLAGPHRPELGTGSLLALVTRDRAGNPAPHTDRAVRQLCGEDPARALVRTLREEAAVGHGDGAYPALRERLRASLSG